MASASPTPSSSHRLPTLSASQALLASQSTDSRVSTGSEELDKAVGGGLARGKITELCGPPGSGKTSLALQSAANALLCGDGNRVAWVDTSHPLPISRLGAMLARSGDPREHFPNLQTIRTPTLAHLLALVMHPLYTFPPENTSLVVIDNVSTPFTAAFPPGMEDDGGGGGGGGGKGKKEPVGVRRFAIMGDLISALSKLAASRGVAVLLLNQMTTKVIPGVGAVLIHSVFSPIWATSLNSRLLIHYNKTSPSILANPDDTPVSQVRYVTILKSNGAEAALSRPAVLLQIQETGVSDVKLVSEAAPAAASLKTYEPRRQKRKRGLEAGVIPGSDEEDGDESEVGGEEEEPAEEMYQWEEGTEDDGMGAAIKSPARDSQNNSQGFTKVGVNGEQEVTN
ncbi:P-loop containing nucleoside triphosphate hydrolase protein [Choiromyces venosus 120613-1]|uniref:DNA repair protein RAD51 homolog 3 n=1 Tax=Choiromyces venosus 120613-1 TaxID=1336337 RepID=A0A3N4IV57_9PEZI|nr:P-loop containing nucleoside triphosphate hydrolase protein [Choiromyces venosus 120613-1]